MTIKEKPIARIFGTCIMLAALAFTQVFAYEPEETHMPLTALAIERSEISNVGFLQNLGLTFAGPFYNSKNEPRDTRIELILDGENFEDTLTKVDSYASVPPVG